MLRGGRAFLAIGLAVSMQASPVRADTKSECLLDHTNGQELRISGKWRAARQRFRACASQACPAPLVADCTRWAEELRDSMPSLLVAASDPDGNDTVEAVLSIDGVRSVERLPVTSMELDPGEHVVRVEHAGWEPIETRIVLRDGEKDKRLGLRFERASPSAAKVKGERRSATAGVIAVGSGVVALGVGVPFLIAGRNKESDLASQPCGASGTCEPSQVDVVRRDYWIGGVVTAVGALAVAFGVWQLVARTTDPPARVVFDGNGVRGIF